MKHFYSPSSVGLKKDQPRHSTALLVRYVLALLVFVQLGLASSAVAETARVYRADYCGTATNGDYSYDVTTSGGKLNFTFVPLAPIAQSNMALLYTRPGTTGGWAGHPQMVKEGNEFKLSINAPADGSVISFYFTYSAAPDPGERNSSATPHVYTVGSTCGAAPANTAPTVSMTTSAGPFIAPATIQLQANATDADGTITKVEFFNGETLLGMDDTAPYTFEWTGVAAGTYSLKAKATDNGTLSTTSEPVAVTVATSGGTTPTYCGVAANGDYAYDINTAGGKVNITFVPLAPIAQSDMALLYTRPGTTGGWMGHPRMVKEGNVFKLSVDAPADGAVMSFYFTYSAAPDPGERNSSANPHVYTVGSTCGTAPANAAPSVTLTTSAGPFTAPATITLSANAIDTDGTIARVEFYNGATLLGSDDSAPYTFEWTNVAAGTYSLTAKAIDNGGSSGTSSATSITVNGTGGGETPVACGTAVNGDYSYNVTTVDGRLNFTFIPLAPIAQSNMALLYTRPGTTGGWAGNPAMQKEGNVFKLSITAPADGSVISFYFTYSAAPDPGERNSLANPHVYTVGSTCGAAPANALPTVTLTSPEANATFAAPATVSLAAMATDTDGTIAKVEFFEGTTLIGTAAASPFTATWSATTAGTYSITAKATDNAGGTSTSEPRTITVTGGTPPTYCSTGNSGDYGYNVTTSGGKLNFTFVPLAPIALSDMALLYTRPGTTGGWMGHPRMVKEGNVFKLSIDAPADGTLISFYFTYSAAPQPGEKNSMATPHTYTVGTTCSAVENVAPTVTMTGPAATASFTAPASVTLTATAADTDGSIAKVEFYNGATLLGEGTLADGVYSYKWSNVMGGSYTITAKATDNANAATTSAALTVTVTKAMPTVSMTGPATNTFTAPAALTLTATAADADGTISKVEFFNGTTLLGAGTATNGVYSFTWNNVMGGTYTITAKATDNDDQVTTSSALTVTVTKAMPTVTMTGPTTGTFTAPAALALSATAADADGTISKVEFFNGTTLLGAGTLSNGVYSYSWNNVMAGTYSITAKATDNDDLSTTSQAMTVTVNKAMPTAAITSHTNGARVNGPGNVVLTATASDPDGTISKVEFFNGTTLLGQAILANGVYSYTWMNVALGTYSITAKVTDNDDQAFTSAAMSIIVRDPLGVKEVIAASDDFKVYPNPAAGVVNISSAILKGSAYTIVDMLGKTVLVGNVNEQEVSIEHLPAGIYTIIAVKNGERVQRRFVKQ
ncbi:Ig-like domain-containing protein [Rufibacter sp. LB8]|uniref:Ig-like domain-containing protein n=1 Tax=Rufibacter sp. LB8 TaxID=2777781 RepID=UPI00178C5EF6|nr:Ig-like domain-containing protein [Rufibacter sp. LB8]